FEEMIRLKDDFHMEMLLLHIRPSEVDEFTNLRNKAIKIMKNIRPDHMVMHVCEGQEYEYVDDHQSIITNIHNVGLDNFTDEYGSYKDTMSNLIEATNMYIDNQNKTLLNPKRKRNKKRGNKSMKQQQTYESSEES